MRSISNIAAVAALVSLATADNAPLANTDITTGISYAATFPNTGANAITGAVLGSVSPDGTGVNFQISFYNLPSDGVLSYDLYTGKVSNGDCSGAGAILNPFNGVTGAQCQSNAASCEVGDLSDKHGDAKILSGGAGTGYFTANYVDQYVSIDPSNQAFFGKGSFVVSDSTGAAVTCANFVNQTKKSANAKANSTSSSTAMSSMAQTQSAGSQASSTSSTGAAVRTAAPIIGAGILGMAALLL